MKTNRTDRLLNAAFDGEASFECLSGEEKAELQRLKSLKAALAGLKDVPECQLSNERLRNAILDKGVKRKNSFGWAAIVATAACAVVAVLFVNQQVIGQIEPRVAVGKAPGAPMTNAVPRATSELIDSTKRDRPAIEVASKPNVKSGRKPSDSIMLKSSGPKIVVAMRSSKDPSAEMVSVGLIAEPTNDQSAVVVVDSAYKTENGSFEAVELEAFGDVVFGG